jgi:hypothetical protein
MGPAMGKVKKQAKKEKEYYNYSEFNEYDAADTRVGRTGEWAGQNPGRPTANCSCSLAN